MDNLKTTYDRDNLIEDLAEGRWEPSSLEEVIGVLKVMAWDILVNTRDINDIER